MREDKKKALVDFLEYLRKLESVTQAILDGEDEKASCEKFGVSKSGYRHLLFRNINRDSEEKVSTEKKYDIVESGEEKIYRLVFNVEKDVPIYNYPNDFKNRLDYCLEHYLKERERKLITEYYLDGKTLADLSEEYKVCRERIRQIMGSGIKKLKNYEPRNILLCGVEYLDRLNDIRNGKTVSVLQVENDIKNLEELCKQEYIARNSGRLLSIIKQCTNLLGVSEEDAKSKDIALVRFRSMNVSEQNFSIRLLNCLKRVGFSNMEQIAYTPVEQLQNVPYLGSKLYKELEEWFSDRGYALKNEVEFKNNKSTYYVIAPDGRGFHKVAY